MATTIDRSDSDAGLLVRQAHQERQAEGSTRARRTACARPRKGKVRAAISGIHQVLRRRGSAHPAAKTRTGNDTLEQRFMKAFTRHGDSGKEARNRDFYTHILDALRRRREFR